ncbi:MAG: glycosyltransferase family 2 protein [Planctomycetes bacterium]|nr:glycosyltransferase family 2 protein [Planctomycetota bacterium]
MDLSVVVPTYREALNLRELVERLCAGFAESGIEGEILVVDDNSNDGTEELCAQLAASHPVRLFVRRTERGLATAVIHGMRQATGRVFLCMDADLSHPPESVPELYRAVASGACEIAIGSRYVEGGSVEEGWGLFRWLNSKVATSLARGLTKVKDPMGGFFAIRREVFLNAPPLAPLGYKILLELLAKCPKARAKEIPIEFKDRKFGESKLNLKQQLLYLRHLRWLYQFRYPVLSEIFQYGLVGLTGLAVDLLAFSFLYRIFLVHHLASRAASFVVAATWNWAWNRRITFEGARSRARLPQWAGFLLVSAVGFLLNWGIYYLLTTRSAFFLSAKELALVCGVVAGFAFNYLGARLLVFGRSVVAKAAGRTAPEPEPQSLVGK